MLCILQARLQHLSSHFNEFGALEQATIEYTPKSGRFASGRVVFKHAEDAAKALSFRAHRMFGIDLNVIAAKSGIQASAEYAAAANHASHAVAEVTLDDTPAASNTNLLDLNDDCLTRIFEHLSVDDLLAVADTCSHFRTISANAFRAQHRRFKINTQNHSDDSLSKVFQYFGQEITDLNVSMHNATLKKRRMMLELVLTHCEDKLESVRLHRFQVDTPILHKLTQLFVRTKKLCLENCHIEIPSDVCLFPQCQSLIKLKISKCSNFDMQYLNGVCFPNLESFTYNDTILENKYFESSALLQQFLRQHTQLTKISINGYLNNYYTILPIIGQCCSQLERLYINAKCDTLEDRQYNELIQSICSLRKLHKLKMQCRNRSPASFMGAAQFNATLKYVEFADGIVDSNLIEHLERFESLCVLILLNMDHAHLVVARIKQIPLTEIVIQGYCDIADEDLVVLVARLKLLRRLVLMDTGYQFSELTYLDLVRTRRRMGIAATLVVQNFETSQKELACSFHSENKRYVRFCRYTKYDNPLHYDQNLRMDDEDDDEQELLL